MQHRSLNSSPFNWALGKRRSQNASEALADRFYTVPDGMARKPSSFVIPPWLETSDYLEIIAPIPDDFGEPEFVTASQWKQMHQRDAAYEDTAERRIAWKFFARCVADIFKGSDLGGSHVVADTDGTLTATSTATPTCPRCESADHVYPVRADGRWICTNCGSYKFSVGERKIRTAAEKQSIWKERLKRQRLRYINEIRIWVNGKPDFEFAYPFEYWCDVMGFDESWAREGFNKLLQTAEHVANIEGELPKEIKEAIQGFMIRYKSRPAGSRPNNAMGSAKRQVKKATAVMSCVTELDPIPDEVA